MTNALVHQDGNTASGHMAGRDVNVTTVSPPPVPQTALGRLFTRLKQKAAGDPTLYDYIKELEIFTRTVENEDVVGLGSKLQAAGRADQIEMATAMKEMVFSELQLNVFSPTFQQIYATLMGKIFEEYETWVKPAILNGQDRQAIDELVSAKVIKPIVAEVELCGDFQGVAPQMIRGMVYFLTGNCHIKWH